MRDPARIAPLLDRLRRAWEANPDLRLGQMVANAVTDDRLYVVEDAVLIEEIEAVHDAKPEADAPAAPAQLKIETTPPYLARQAIDAAMSDINDAMEAWRAECERSPEGDDYPYGDHEIELRPDSQSLGFEVVFTFSEDVGPDASLIRDRLAAVLERHGVATVTVLGTNIDYAGVKAFDE